MAQELRNQWPEHELKTNHHGSRSSAWSLEDVDDENGKGGVDDAFADLSMLAQDGMTDEGLMLMEAAEETAQEALALMDRGRRTLREARSRPGVLIVVFGFCCVGFFVWFLFTERTFTNRWHASVWTLRPFTIFGDAVIPTV